MSNRDFIDEILVGFGTSPNPVASGLLKLDYKTAIVQKLILELENANDSSENGNIYFNLEKLDLLKCLRIVCKEAAGCETLVEEKTIEMLSKFGRLTTNDAGLISLPSSVESLKCLANLQTILPDMRTLFSNSLVIRQLVPTLNLDGISLGVAFLVSRLIFFSSAVNPKQAELLLEEGALDALAKVVNADMSGKMKREDWVPVEGFYNEVLKTGFNLTLTTSPLSTSILSSVKTIVELDGTDPSIVKYHNYLKIATQICLTSPLGTPKLAPPHLHAVNTLMNMPCLNPDIWFPQNDFSFLNQLLDIFEESFKIMAPEKESDSPGDEEIFGSTPDQALIPICLLLKKLTIIPDARKKIKDRLLPSNVDRTKPLTDGPSLTAALIRAMTSVRLHQTKDFMCDLMVSCFEDNVEKFVRYVGYANAAGYLFNRGIPSPLGNEAPKKENLDDNFPDNVDPMTGKFAEPKPDPWAGMTDEEKERESERLFVLFDRLNKSGIIKTEMKRD